MWSDKVLEAPNHNEQSRQSTNQNKVTICRLPEYSQDENEQEEKTHGQTGSKEIQSRTLGKTTRQEIQSRTLDKTTRQKNSMKNS
jgi:hypothetical protein